MLSGKLTHEGKERQCFQKFDKKIMPKINQQRGILAGITIDGH